MKYLLISLLIISTYTLANQEKYIRFNVVYNIENKRILSVISEENTDQATKEKCEAKLASGQESKKFESITKGKTGTVKLTYFCQP